MKSDGVLVLTYSMSIAAGSGEGRVSFLIPHVGKLSPESLKERNEETCFYKYLQMKAVSSGSFLRSFLRREGPRKAGVNETRSRRYAAS